MGHDVLLFSDLPHPRRAFWLVDISSGPLIMTLRDKSFLHPTQFVHTQQAEKEWEVGGSSGDISHTHTHIYIYIYICIYMEDILKERTDFEDTGRQNERIHQMALARIF